jgi:opacity protein-like surface antigen
MICRLHDKAALRRLATAAVIATSVARAHAADMPDDSWLRGSYTVDSPGFVRWDGLQIGAQVGWGTMNADFGNAGSDQISYILRNTTLQNEFQPSSWTTLPNVGTNSSQYGFFIGYNWQWSELVLGVDAAYNKMAKMEADAEDSIGRQVTTSDGTVHQVFIDSAASLKLVDYATLRAKAGYAFGQFLPYAMLGAAVGRFNYTTSATVTDVWTPAGGGTTTFGPTTQTDQKDNAFSAGFLVGLGMDVALLPNVFLRGEWEFIAFAPVGGIRSQLNTGRVGVGVRF